MKLSTRASKRIFVLAGVMALVSLSGAQTIDPFYASNYEYVDLGSVSGLPSYYGGLTCLPDDPNTLLIGGDANTATGLLYTVGVTRDVGGHINGFSGAATIWGDGAYNDGGVVFNSSGVLFAAQWPVNKLSQYKPGSTTPDRVDDLAALGVADSVSAFNFIPYNFPNANKMKLVSWEGGQWYDVTLTGDGSGTYNVAISSPGIPDLVGGPEGFAYVPLGSTLFANPSMILSEYSAGVVSTYELDANGDPIAATRRVFMSGLDGAEGAFIDPLTGDFVFSTFGGGDRIVVVKGFAPVPEPASMATILIGLGALVFRRRR